MFLIRAFEIVDAVTDESEVLRPVGGFDESYPFLGHLDPAGATYFSRLQASEVRREVGRLPDVRTLDHVGADLSRS